MGAIRDVAGNPIATTEGIPVTTENISTLTPQQLTNTHEIPAAGATVSTMLPGLDKVFPGPSASVEQIPAAVQSSNVSGNPPGTPVSNSTTTETAGTIMDYASRYGLLAGGILAALIIGTVIVRKIIKRKN